MLYISIVLCFGGDFSTKHLANIILLLDHASFVKNTQNKKPIEYSKPMSCLQEEDSRKNQQRKFESQLLNGKKLPSLPKEGLQQSPQAPLHSSSH